MNASHFPSGEKAGLASWKGVFSSATGFRFRAMSNTHTSEFTRSSSSTSTAIWRPSGETRGAMYACGPAGNTRARPARSTITSSRRATGPDT